MHCAIAKRAFGLTNKVTGGFARAPQAVHDRISSAVYAGVGAGTRAISSGLRAADNPGVGPRLESSNRGRFVLSAVNGLLGDRLQEEQPTFAIQMAVRSHGRDVPLDPASLRATYPRATGDLVVFLHGLSENEDYWNRHCEQTGGSYAERLAGETSWTPVLLRANTGLPIADNGVALADLLDKLVGEWPTDVSRIALVGHSMGGLIMRAASAVVTDAATQWNTLVNDVVTLAHPTSEPPWPRRSTSGRQQ